VKPSTTILTNLHPRSTIYITHQLPIFEARSCLKGLIQHL